MKLTTIHVATLAVLMYGLSSAAYLLGEDAFPAATSPPPAVPAVPPGAATPTVAPTPGTPVPPSGAPYLVAPTTPMAPSVIPRPALLNDGGKKSEDELKILELKNADAETSAQQLRSLIPGNLTIVPDERTNSLIIRGKPEECAKAEALLLKLDQTETKNPTASAPARRGRSSVGPGAPATATLVAPNGATMSAGNGTLTIDGGKATISSGGGGGSSGTNSSAGRHKFEIHTFQLKHANSNDVYNSLMATFKEALSKPGAGANWNLSDDRHINDLIVTAPKEDFPQIDALITQLDSSDALQPASDALTDAAKQLSNASKRLSNTDAALQQAQTTQQLYNNLIQQVQSLPAAQQPQFEKVLKQFEETQRRLADQTAVQSQLREDMARRNQELRKRYEEQARRNTEDAEQMMKTQALQQRLNALANDIRTLTSKSGDAPSDQQKSEIEALKAKLKDTLSRQFDDQQKSESDELQQLRERLEKLEKEISDRAQSRNQVIQQRLNGLLSANRAALPNSGTMPVRITSPQLILDNVPGSGTLQLDASTPGTITLTQPVTISPATNDFQPASGKPTADPSSDQHDVDPATGEGQK
ncbi:MAG TPA: secretin N-terminal domain-containing protein [Pirellulales bacterium]|jgi:hypothetical protein|nr:secretin N-terminal domain-containing protein [Pirellulales bacterium]